MANKVIYIGAAVVVIAILVGVLVESGVLAGATGTGKGNIALQLTDPPQVPSGTQSLVVTYSSAQLHLLNKNGTSTWVNSSQSGSADLLSLVNLTQTIASFSVAANVMITQARFNVTSAKITVNGTTYPVAVPEPEITANVTSNSSVNSTSSVVVDLSPTVITIFTSNSTLFVMVPSVRAVLVPGLPPANIHIGAKGNLTVRDRDELEHIRPNMRITGAALSVNGNVTSLSVTVVDDSNQSVRLKQVVLRGTPSVVVALNDSVTANSTIQAQMPLATVGSNASVNASTYPGNIYASGNLNSRDGGGMMNGGAESSDHVSALINGRMEDLGNAMAANLSLGTSGVCQGECQNEVRQSYIISRFAMLDFIVLANGTLALPYSYIHPLPEPYAVEACVHPVESAGVNASAGSAVNITGGAYVSPAVYCLPYNESGYLLQPGQSVTLTFNGRIGFGGVCEPPPPGVAEPMVRTTTLPNIPIWRWCPFSVGIVPGENYTIDVTGTRGAFAATTVTATGNLTTVYGGGTGTVTGRVFIGPLCPGPAVIGNGNPCNASNPYASRMVTMKEIANGNNSYNISMNSTGSFTARVASGLYALSITICTFLGCRSLPEDVSVLANQTTVVNVDVYTGLA